MAFFSPFTNYLPFPNLKTIVLGKNSFVASHLPYEKVSDYLTADEREINHFLDRHNPNIIINCIGYCGSKNIDDCEINKEKTYTSNLIIPIMLAGACEKRGIRMVHIGSGCIFNARSPHAISKLMPANDGTFYPDEVSPFQPYRPEWIDSGWNETDSPNPKSFYSKTKAAADLILGEMRNTAVLRIRMPISNSNSPRNLLSKITGYKKIVETPNSITFLDDLRRAIDWVINKDLSGIYNVCHPIPFIHNQLLDEYKKYDTNHTWENITPEQLDKIVSAPRSNCLIDSGKLIATGFQFGDAKKQMEDCVREFARLKLSI